LTANEILIRAVQKSTRRLASSGNFDQVLNEVLAICVEAVGASGGTIYIHDSGSKRLKFRHVLPESVADKLPVKDIADDYGVAGSAFQSRATVRIERAPNAPVNDFEKATGVTVNNMIATPLMMEDEEPIGVVQLLNKLEGAFTDADAAVLDTVAAVSTMAYLNYRLTDETARAGSLIGMGKVSHDIGNLAASLYANLSFSDMAMDGLRDQLKEFGENDTLAMYADTIDEMFHDLRSSVDRIVGYSRLISDLSAGRQLRPNFQLSPLSDTIRTSAAYLESEGRKNKVAIRYEIDEDAPALLHDELYLFRIVQNLVGNAIKAVVQEIPEDWIDRADEDSVLGEVTVRYRFSAGEHIVEIQDSGPGMTREVAERILSGNARSQWQRGGGSGWGTKIVLELAATHEARVEIESEVGHGATFRVVFPHRTQALT
jgi:signal transduction histidine kinase